MPHFQIEYSASLEAVVDIGQLCEAIRARAATIETFPMAGIRVRATRVDHVAMQTEILNMALSICPFACVRGAQTP